MLIQLRENPEITRERASVKLANAASRIFEVMGSISHLPQALDLATLGDHTELANITSTVADLEEYLRDKDMRIKSVKDSGVLKSCQITLAALLSDNVNVAVLQESWGKCYASFLALYDQQQRAQDKTAHASAVSFDTAAEVEDIPYEVGPKGFVISHLPLVFTTHTSILSKLKRYPQSFEATQWAGGYLFQKQLILGVETEGKSQQAITNKINAVIGAYKAQGRPVVNVLGAGRKFPYFHHKGNPLAFAWLMPEETYSVNPLHVNSVQFNTSEPTPDVAPTTLSVSDKLRKNKQERELFETFLNTDKTYSHLVEQVRLDKSFGDSKAAMSNQVKANKRKEALRKQWVEGKDADPIDEAPIKTPVKTPKREVVAVKTLRTPLSNKTFGRLTAVGLKRTRR